VIPDPTHVLAVAPSQVRQRELVQSCHSAVAAGLDHGSVVDLYLDLAHIPAIGAAPLTGVADTFELVDDGHYRGELPDDARAVARLLDVEDTAEVAAIDRLVFGLDDRPYLAYRPDEPRLELDDDIAEGVAADVREVLADLPAGLLPADSIVKWRHDDREYELHPPYLRAGDARFDLANLVAVGFDRERRRIDLGWDTTDRGFLARLRSHFGVSRPTRFEFDTTGGYERVADGFETVAGELGVMANENRPVSR